MKQLPLFFFVLTAIIIGTSSCHKSHILSTPPPATAPIDYSNVNLRDMPLDTIRKAILGRWQIHYDSTFGYTGWVKRIHANDFLSFLTNDTIKREINSFLIVYDKAEVTRGPSPWGIHDTVYTFKIPNSLFAYTIDNIYNDTLKIEQPPQFFYLTKKP